MRIGLVALLAALAIALATTPAAAQAQPVAPFRLDSGRFTIIAWPADAPLARAMLGAALRHDTFPGLPRPRARALVAIAPDERRFREWIGPHAPEWGAAIAFPALQRIVMQGRTAGSDAGDPLQVLRHELAHLALHEALGDIPTRWFDEGYASWAAGEWSREQTLATNVALAVRGMPTLPELEESFHRGAGEAGQAYALAYRAVAELAALDRERGLTLFLRYWKEDGRFDTAVRRAYGITGAAFEKHWRSRTRRAYGALALVADFTLATAIFSTLLVPLWIARRRRDRRRMAALVAADREAERRAREQSALDALLGAAPPGEAGAPAEPSSGAAHGSGSASTADAGADEPR